MWISINKRKCGHVKLSVYFVNYHSSRNIRIAPGCDKNTVIFGVKIMPNEFLIRSILFYNLVFRKQ